MQVRINISAINLIIFGVVTTHAIGLIKPIIKIMPPNLGIILAI